MHIEAWPEGVATDGNVRRLFYTDYNMARIATVDYDSKDHDVILTSAHNLHHPRAIVLHPETRYGNCMQVKYLICHRINADLAAPFE